MYDFLNEVTIELKDGKTDKSTWRRCIFDLEGSLHLGGDILQVACITTDWDFNIIGASSLYFNNNNPINEKEQKVHGITEQKLKEKAVGHFSEEYIRLPLVVNKPTMFISYTLFDVRRINDELGLYNKEKINFGEECHSLETDVEAVGNKHFDAFIFSGKRRLSSIASTIPDNEIDDIYKDISKFIVIDKGTSHEAMFDVVITLALCRRNYNGKDKLT